LDRKLGMYLFGVGGDSVDVSREQQKRKQTEASVEHLMMVRLHVQGALYSWQFSVVEVEAKVEVQVVEQKKK
jgi:hypothetical protein